MRYRLAGVALLPVLVALVAATTLDSTRLSTSNTRTDPDGLIAHEWGTFTSIAGQDGKAIEWQPVTGPSDVPCFVHRLRMLDKGLLAGTVRMETPVIYFYSPTNTRVNVNVRFPKGVISEWFPKATVTPSAIDPPAFARANLDSRISWSDVEITPGANESFPTETAKNHYYAARATEATPLAVGAEREKYLFYRGVGKFEPPIRATVQADGKIDVANPDGLPLGDLVLFENRGGTITFQIARASGTRVSFDAASPRGDLEIVYASLERTLVNAGLYQKEAAAMVETWRDSWFEQGTRLLYIAPKASVEAILPLEITPRPREIARVFVGRVELITPTTRDDVRVAVLNRDSATLRKYGRFFQPIVEQVLANTAPVDVPAFKQQLQSAYSSWVWNAPSCNNR